MARAKLKGKDIRKIGYQEGRAIGQAIQAMETHYKGKSRVFKLDLLKRVLDHPAFYAKDDKLGSIAQELLVQKEAAQRPALNTQRKPYRIYGAEHIEEGARHQMEVVMKLPITVEGALMPDAHLGYGLPIGGVLATDNAVIPYAVGVDIACRMRLSVFDVPAEQLDRLRDTLPLMVERLLEDPKRWYEENGLPMPEDLEEEAAAEEEARRERREEALSAESLREEARAEVEGGPS